MGLMASKEIQAMSTKFVERIIPDFIGENKKSIWTDLLFDVFMKIMSGSQQFHKSKATIPQEYHDEIKGIVDGCRAANPSFEIDIDDIWALNISIDCLLSVIYSLEEWLEDRITPPDELLEFFRSIVKLLGINFGRVIPQMLLNFYIKFLSDKSSFP